MKTRAEHIAMIRANLADNEKQWQEGKRSKSLYLTCKKDGERRISEINAEPASLWPNG